MSFEMRGPLFDGRAVVMAQHMTDEIEQEIALDAGVQVIDELNRVMKHPTGYYTSQIDVEPYAGGYRVWDQGVVYGPWLAQPPTPRLPRLPALAPHI
jgi:hypothetical protein